MQNATPCPLPPTARAVVFTAAGAPLELRELPLRPPRGAEILVRVTCCTICGSDLHTYTGRRREATPTILGHEITGRVAQFGPQALQTGFVRAALERGRPHHLDHRRQLRRMLLLHPRTAAEMRTTFQVRTSATRRRSPVERRAGGLLSARAGHRHRPPARRAFRRVGGPGQLCRRDRGRRACARRAIAAIEWC